MLVIDAANLLNVFIKDWKNALKLSKMDVKNIYLKETGDSSDQKFACLANPGHYISNKTEKSIKIREDNKNWIYAFAFRLIAIVKV